MIELIAKTKQGVELIDARLLYENLNVGRDFSNWIKSRIEKYDFQRNRDYFVEDNQFQNTDNQILRQNGRKIEKGRPTVDYFVTITMAKELCLLQNNETGRRYRRYLIRIEEETRKQMLNIPTPKIFNQVKCIHYTGWLLQNGYSIMSGQVRARIKKYPEQFRKTDKGWYMSEAIAEYFLNFKNPQQRIAEMPSVNPQFVLMFSKEELQEMTKK